MSKERPGKLGIFPLEYKDPEDETRFIVQIPKEKIQAFVLWLYSDKIIFHDTSVRLRPRYSDTSQYFNVSFMPIFIEKEKFLTIFTKFCEKNGLTMVNVEEGIKIAKEIMGEKF